MKFSYHSDIGLKRAANQDRCCVLSNQAQQTFGIVCDGMGGHLAGETAAQMALDILCQAFIEKERFYSVAEASQWLLDAVEKANRAIYIDANSDTNHQGMGTTLVAVLVIQHSLIVCHAGDSRAYIYANAKLQQLTKDHTYVNLLVENGSINKEQAQFHPQKNVLMKAVGVFENLVTSHKIYDDMQGTLLLCSDGLYNLVSDIEMMNVLAQATSLEDKTLQLIQIAKQNGGFDNISCVLIDLGGGVNDE